MTAPDRQRSEADAERKARIAETLPAIADAVLSVDYGTVTLSVRDGQIVLLEVTRRQRFDREERDHKPRQD